MSEAEYERLDLLVDTDPLKLRDEAFRLLADNARLTAALGEAERERDQALADLDRCHVLFAEAGVDGGELIAEVERLTAALGAAKGRLIAARATAKRNRDHAKVLAHQVSARYLPDFVGVTFNQAVQGMARSLGVRVPTDDEAGYLLWERSCFPMGRPEQWCPQVAAALIEPERSQ
jgi:hypothetical protein